MIIIKKLLSIIISWLLIILLIFLSFSFFLYQDLKTPNKIEGWVSKSGLYQLVINNLTEQGMTSFKVAGLSKSDKQSLSSTIASTLRQTISRSYFNKTIDTVTNANFRWLSGNSNQPNFSVSLSQIQSSFIQNLSVNIQSSPICLSQPGYPSNECLPIAQVFNLSVGSISKNFLLLNQANINQNNINNFLSSSHKLSTKPYYQRYSYLPSDYQLMLKLPFIMVGLVVALLLLSLFIFGISFRLIKLVIKVVLSSTIVLLLLTFLNNNLLKWIENLSVIKNNQASQVIVSIIGSAGKDLSATNISFIKGYIVFAGLMILLWILRKIIPKHKNKNNNHQSPHQEPDIQFKNSDRNILIQ